METLELRRLLRRHLKEVYCRREGLRHHRLRHHEEELRHQRERCCHQLLRRRQEVFRRYEEEYHHQGVMVAFLVGNNLAYVEQ